MSSAAMSEGAVPTGSTTRPRVAFQDLAWARFEFEHARARGEDVEARSRYEVVQRLFEEQEGWIVQEFWATYARVGVAVTVRPGPRLLQLLGAGKRYQLHRSSEQVGLPREFEQALAEGDTLARKAGDVLNAGAARAIIERVFEAHKYLLSVANAEYRLDKDWDRAVRSEVAFARRSAGERRPPEEARPAMPTEPRSVGPEPADA